MSSNSYKLSKNEYMNALCKDAKFVQDTTFTPLQQFGEMVQAPI